MNSGLCAAFFHFIFPPFPPLPSFPYRESHENCFVERFLDTFD